jgi:hypothetical protein
MPEDALKIISVALEDAGPDGGPDHDHDALVLIDLPTDDRPAEMSEGTCASTTAAASARSAARELTGLDRPLVIGPSAFIDVVVAASAPPERSPSISGSWYGMARMV